MNFKKEQDYFQAERQKTTNNNQILLTLGAIPGLSMQKKVRAGI
jgi:hypothetical protein